MPECSHGTPGSGTDAGHRGRRHLGTKNAAAPLKGKQGRKANARKKGDGEGISMAAAIKDEAEELVHLVESVVGKRLKRGGERGAEYLVMWKGFSAAQSTWEPVSQFVGGRSHVAIEAFEATQLSPKKATKTKRRAEAEADAPTKPKKRLKLEEPELLQEDHEDEACACCMVKPDVSDRIVTPCRHVFCLECITTWLNQHFDVTDETSPQQRCPVCRAGLRQFARRIQITAAIADAPAADGAPQAARAASQPRVAWSIAEAQQLQALVLGQPHSIGGKVIEGDVDWEAVAVSLGTDRTAGAVKQRARSMELITSAAAAAVAARASSITEEIDDDQELTSDDDDEAVEEVKEPTPNTGAGAGAGAGDRAGAAAAQVRVGAGARVGAMETSPKTASVSAGEASYRRFLQRTKPQWRSQAQQRRAKRLQALDAAAPHDSDTSSFAAAVVPAAAAVYSDDSDSEPAGNQQRWQWSGVSGVAPWVEEDRSFVSEVLQVGTKLIILNTKFIVSNTKFMLSNREFVIFQVDEVEEAEWIVEAVVDKRLREPCGTPEWEVKWWGNECKQSGGNFQCLELI